MRGRTTSGADAPPSPAGKAFNLKSALLRTLTSMKTRKLQTEKF
jgi:hypothetical protein